LGVSGLKPVFRLFGTFFGVLYFGGLIYYFVHQAGSFEEAKNEGLGPTIVGLGIVVLILLIVLIVKLTVTFVAWRSPKSGRASDGPTGDDDDGFDPDAVIARYMARQSAEAASNSPAMPPRNGGSAPPRRSGFGRKNG
jgi:hypothetical protein